MLLTWALANRSLGYRQGMNELAGVLYFVRRELVELLKASTDVQSPEYLALMSEKHVEHDVFALFDRLMFTGLESFFAHEDMIKKAKKGANKLPGDNRIYGFLADDYNVASGEQYKNIKLPIVKKASHIFNVKLKTVDHQLQFHMEAIKVEPQWFMMYAPLTRPPAP